MNNSITDNNKLIEDYKKQEEENIRKKIEVKLEEEKISEKQKEDRKKFLKRQREIERQQKENEKILEKNEKLNKKRFDNDETYTWGELVMRENSFITVEETEEIWIYSKNLGYYTPNGGIYLKKLCADGGPRTNDPQVLRQLMMFITGKSFKKLDDFVHPEHLMNLKNGVIDMNKEELLPKSPIYNFQNMLNVTYNKEAKCPNWEYSLMNMFESEKDYIRTQKWFGYHLLRENKEQVMHGYFGDSGAGKSTMLHILVELLGKENVTHFNLQDFNSRVNAYSIGRLYGKLANITFDMISTPIKDGVFEMIKNLTSSDRINGRNIRQSPFEFVPHAKLTFACNKLPYVEDRIVKAPEFKRRMILTKVIKRPSFKKDPDLYMKFLNELHSGGIYNWILEGRKKYLNDPKGFNFDHESIPDIWKEEYDTTQDEPTITLDELINANDIIKKALIDKSSNESTGV